MIRHPEWDYCCVVIMGLRTDKSILHLGNSIEYVVIDIYILSFGYRYHIISSLLITVLVLSGWKVCSNKDVLFPNLSVPLNLFKWICCF